MECFVGSSGVEDAALVLDVAGEVDAVVDVVPVELFVFQGPELVRGRRCCPVNDAGSSRG